MTTEEKEAFRQEYKSVTGLDIDPDLYQIKDEDYMEKFKKYWDKYKVLSGTELEMQATEDRLKFPDEEIYQDLIHLVFMFVNAPSNEEIGEAILQEEMKNAFYFAEKAGVLKEDIEVEE